MVDNIINGNAHDGPWNELRRDVDFDFELRPDVSPLRLDLGRGRGNKRRGTGAIPRSNSRLYLALKRAWEERHRSCDHVVSYRGKGLTKINLEAAYRRAGLMHYRRRNHLLKHTTCSLLVQAGRTVEEVAKLIGTRAETIRKHYGHLSPEHMETAGAVLQLLEIGGGVERLARGDFSAADAGESGDSGHGPLCGSLPPQPGVQVCRWFDSRAPRRSKAGEKRNRSPPKIGFS